MRIMRAHKPGRWRRAFLALALALVVALAALLALWRFAPPVSTLMLGRYISMKRVERVYVPLERMAPALVEAVVVAEDARFC